MNWASEHRSVFLPLSDITLIVFDLDGTLTNSLRDISDAVNYTLKQLHFDPLSRETIRGYIGDGIPTLMRLCLQERAAVTPELLEKAVGIYRPYYDAHCLDHVSLYPHALEILDYFNSIKKAVVSNKMEAFTKKILAGLHILDYFDCVIGGDTLPEKKPSAVPIRHILQRLHVPSTQAIMIGDSAQDVQSGKAAGVRTCGVTYGFRDRADIADADFIIEDLIELKTIIRKP